MSMLLGSTDPDALVHRYWNDAALFGEPPDRDITDAEDPSNIGDTPWLTPPSLTSIHVGFDPLYGKFMAEFGTA